jgi:hypothetical protein
MLSWVFVAAIAANGRPLRQERTARHEYLPGRSRRSWGAKSGELGGSRGKLDLDPVLG